MTDKLKILMLSAEMVPFAKVGGLADVAGALPRALRVLGHDVRVAMPRYGRIDPAQFNLQKVLNPFPVPLDGASDNAAILEGKLDGNIPVYFIENKRLFDRDGIYMYQDDAERFIFFARASLEMLRRLNWQPDVIHCHDWHTALIPNWLRTIYATDRFFADTATVYTIHNIAYQGIFGLRILEIAGLMPYGFIAHPSVAPDLHQLIDFMARGISFADKITTVSETYAREIQTPEFGEKLDPFLRDRREHLVGILNGLDTVEYDPATDTHLAQTFDARTLDARAANKTALQRELGLPQIAAPLLAMVSRLTNQKGLALVTDAIDHVLDTLPLQFVVMGAGDQNYHDFFARLRERYPDRVSVTPNYNPALARRIHGGADMLLMPSRTEPCGTDQMIAMRYGCIPIVRATGGLADTVQDFDLAQNTGAGFVFRPFDRWAMFAAIVRATQVYAASDVWRGLQTRAMAHDFSWDTAGKKYDALYREALIIHERAAQTAHALAEDMDHTAQMLAALPPRLVRLGELAYNLWWGWNPAGRYVFEDLDPVLWEQVYRNPVRLLRELGEERLRAASQDPAYLEKFDAALAQFDAYIQPPTTWFGGTYPYIKDTTIAYFSAEFGLHQCLPIYSGGLGILSGDHIKEASDLGLPFVGVGFLYPQGYFTQKLNPDGWQEAIYEKLNFALVPALPAKTPDGRDVMIEVELPGRSVYVKVWRIQVGRAPLFLMDTNVDVNAPADRELAARLYGGDNETRLVQEFVLGIGGVRVLRALGYNPGVWHLNEGHSSFSIIERLRELAHAGVPFAQARERVRATTVFTTHTPVAAGHDAFSPELMQKYFGGFVKQLGLSREEFFNLANHNGAFSMTVLALRFAGAANGVSQLHGQVSRKMWQWLYPGKSEDQVPIGAVTNGVHTLTWLAPAYHTLFDEFLPRDWRERLDDPGLWDAVDHIPDERLWELHRMLKQRLYGLAQERAGATMDPEALTLGFARRFATYKRAVLMFRDAERLKRILNHPERPVQILFSGKAHPADNPGKEFIRAIVQFSRQPGFAGRIAFIEDYDIKVARHLVQGVDVWLNNPRRPLEASGTSGEKASVNGAPNFSVLDGWWREGYIATVNGWAIGEDRAWDNADAQDAADAESFYATLEREVAPYYYSRDAYGIPREWVRKMKNAIKTIAPRYSTKRMLKEYVTNYYVPVATR
ncbi:MAG: alpha-glucan family phosphorylase [Chloroflexi bacterium]|nr:alpha-glucan family phosphorylase [Chloroflexota bacterium]